MADSIKFTIGGRLGPSYRGALAEAEREAKTSNERILGALRLQQRAIAAAMLVPGTGAGETAVLTAQQEKNLRMQNLLYTGMARIRVREARGAETEIVETNREALDRIMAQERAAGAVYENEKAAEIAAADILEGERVAKELAAIEARKVADAEAMAASIRDTTGAMEWANIAEEQRTAAAAAEAVKRTAIRKAELLAQIEADNLSVARGGGARTAQQHWGHGGGGGISGIIRESTVIMREIMMGRGGGRIAGSVTLLAQYMGVLGKVVHSTAGEALAHAAAESTLAQKMAATAAAAKGQFGYTHLLIQARSQEKVATDAVTKAEIALQTAKVTVNPFGWALIAGVAVAAVLVGIAMHMHTLAVRAKNLTELLDPLKKKFTEEAEAVRDASKRHEEYLEWLKKIGAEAETLPEKLEAVIKKLREQSQAQLELARAKGVDRMAIEAMEEAQLKEELRLTTLAKLQAKRAQEQAQLDADVAEKAYNGSKGTMTASDARSMAHAAHNAGAIVDAVEAEMQGKMIATPTGRMIPSPFGGAAPGVMVHEMTNRPAGENDPFTVKVDGKEITTTLAKAKAAFNDLTDKSAALAAAQEKVKKDFDNASTTLEERNKDLRKLSKAEQDYQDQLDIKEKFGKAIAAAQGGHAGKISETEWERAGGSFGGAGVSVMDTLKEQLKVQRQIAHNTGHHGTAPNNAGGDHHY